MVANRNDASVVIFIFCLVISPSEEIRFFLNDEGNKKEISKLKSEFMISIKIFVTGITHDLANYAG